MKTLFTKFLVKLILPIIALLFEEAVKLILEAISDDGMSRNQKVQYVVRGVSDRIDTIDRTI